MGLRHCTEVALHIQVVRVMSCDHGKAEMNRDGPTHCDSNCDGEAIVEARGEIRRLEYAYGLGALISTSVTISMKYSNN